jgi:hypothetical protein
MNRRDLLVGAATLMQGFLVGAAAVGNAKWIRARAEAFILRAQNPLNRFQMANIPTR